MINTTERSRILLLNLGLDTDKSCIKAVGVAELKEIFAGFGALTKVIVFTRKTLLKAFVEFSEAEGAERAKIALHEKVVKSYGKARLYYSPLQHLKFSNKYLEFWEQGAPNCAQNCEEDNSTKNSLMFAGSENIKAKGNRKGELRASSSQFNIANGYSLFAKSAQHRPDPASQKQSFISAKSSPFGATPFDPLLAPAKPFDGGVATALCGLSRVVLVSNLGNIFRSCAEAFNLFSAFGNICTILLMKNHQKALVEYTDLQYANEAITNLNGLAIGETKLHLSYSKYPSIDLQKNNKNENSCAFNEVYVVPGDKNRYAPQPHTAVASLSSSLLISFPRASKAQTLDVYLAIEKLCKPLKTKLVSGKGKLDSDQLAFMLFSFADVQSAVYVMYKCHHSTIKGALLDISFF